jgi:hypothetical protein
MRFLGFSNHEKGAPRLFLKQTVYSTLSRSGWGVVRSASLAGYFEKETVTAPPQSFDSE